MSVPAPSGTEIKSSACPLDCPDACSLDVTVEAGKVVKIDGNERNEITAGYICRKVRHFPELMYGPDRLLHPEIRVGAKGEGTFRTATWDEALEMVSAKLGEVRDQFGAESILPYCYGGSNGYLTQDSVDARFFRRLGASRIDRTLCAAAAGRASKGLYGGMAGIAMPDFTESKLIVLWGVNPSASGIHLVPYIQEARKRGARLVVVDPRTTPLAAGADQHLAIRPGTDVIVALAIHRWLFETGRADSAFLARHATGVEDLRRRAEPWTFAAAAAEAGLESDDLEAFAKLYAELSPAAIRCGWGVERNRNGGSSVAAILALPAVAGKFGVRGGGYTLSNSGAWDFDSATAAAADGPPTRVINMNLLGRELLERNDPPVAALFVYNCNPLATVPNQELVRRGLARDDLFTVVFEQVRTDTCRYADVILPATTFLEHAELRKGYGALVLNRSRPAAPPVGEARPNYAVFAELCRRMGLARPGDHDDSDSLVDAILATSADRERLLSTIGNGAAQSTVEPAVGPRPVQFVDVFPKTADRKVHLLPSDLDAEAPEGLYGYQPLIARRRDSGERRYPLTLISPALASTVSSTLAQLLTKPAAVEMNAADAALRGVSTGDSVRLFNDLGEVRCLAKVTADVRPGVAVLPKGLWARHTANGATACALAPDTLTDLGGGACFNDARIEIERAPV
jgi:anaerobic selenocysteine-containing dehydrogenase